jgi:hypothetical protein
VSKPPPEDLMEWSKGDLAREVRRLRAITYENAERRHGEARLEGSRPPMMTFSEDPHSYGTTILDARGAVLLSSVDVCLVDTKQGGDGGGEEVVLAMTLGGRINYRAERSETLYMFDADGAAAIITQLFGLAVRIGPEFATLLMERLEEVLNA